MAPDDTMLTKMSNRTKTEKMKNILFSNVELCFSNRLKMKGIVIAEKPRQSHFFIPFIVENIEGKQR